MEITLDKKSTTEGLIKIKVTEGDYQPHVEEKVKDYARKANIKGFRPGKVPAGVIRRMFGKSILVDEINHLLSHKLSDYIKDNNLKILGDPLPNQDQTETIDWEVQKDFEFEYQIGMVDDFTYDLSPKVKVDYYPIEVGQPTIDETVEDLKKRFGKVNYPETSEAGDNLFGDLYNEDGTFHKEYAAISIDKVSDDQKKAFTGLRKEDEVTFDIDTIFSDPGEKVHLLGTTDDEANEKTGTYRFKVATISRVQPADINQELFDRVFGKDTVTDEAGFLAKIRETVSENYQRESDHFLEHNIEDYFISHTTIDLPEEFLKTWLKKTNKEAVTDDVISKEFESYKRGLIWDLIKNKIAEDHKISVEADEVRSKAKELIVAQFGGQTFADQIQDRLDAIADNYLSHENGQNFMKLYHQLRNEKILGHIKQNITLKEKKVSLDEFKNIVETHTH